MACCGIGSWVQLQCKMRGTCVDGQCAALMREHTYEVPSSGSCCGATELHKLIQHGDWYKETSVHQPRVWGKASSIVFMRSVLTICNFLYMLQRERERTRILYERLLDRTHHVKVWLSYARFEWAPQPPPEADEDEDEEQAAARCATDRHAAHMPSCVMISTHCMCIVADGWRF